MRPFVVGTAGHVDHGKTSLVRALTGVDTDRLPEERARGISIELGFARWDVAPGVRASVIDVPGHSRLVHAMIAGAAGIEIVLLVVAANEGVMPQTREHVAVCEALGITRGVVALSKADLVDAETVALAEVEVRDLLGRGWAAAFVPCSTRTGRGLEDVRAAVASAAHGLPERADAGVVRLPIDRVFSPRGAGVVVTGTLVEGALVVGAELLAVGPQGAVPVRVRGLAVHGEEQRRVAGPTRVAVRLGSVARAEVTRGSLLTSDPSVRSTRQLDACVAGDDRVRSGAHRVVHAGTSRSPARVARVDRGADGRCFVRLTLTEPLVVVAGQRLVLRDADARARGHAPVASALALDVHPSPAGGRETRTALLEAVAQGDVRAAVAQLVARAVPRPVDPSALDGRFPWPHEETRAAARELVASGRAVLLPDGTYLDRGALGDLAIRARQLVADHLHAQPLDAGMPLETLRLRLAAVAGYAAADAALLLARAPRGPDDEAMIAIDGPVATVRALAGALDRATASRLQRLERVVDAASDRGITEFTAAETAGIPPEEVRRLLARLARERRVVLAGDLWFSAGAVDRLRSRLEHHLARARRTTVLGFKPLTGLPRRQAIALLEHFDRAGVTRRVGDARELREAPK